MAELPQIASASYLDRLVGEVAGAVCRAISEVPGMRREHFILLPVITYKVKMCLAREQGGNNWTEDHLPAIARDIRASIAPLVWAFDLNLGFGAFDEVGPRIEASALRALRSAA